MQRTFVVSQRLNAPLCPRTAWKAFMRGLGAALFLALILCGMGAASAATVPGAIPGGFGVSETGAATYSIPITVPPGTAGMAPKLSLNYSSQGGNGIAGVGWSIGGLSAITRCPQTIVQDGQTRGVQLDANDRFCLDGQRLIVISGATYGAPGAEYRTEIESFSKIVSVGGTAGDPQSFKVWTKAGQIIEYGNTTDARVEAQGKTIAGAWAVNKISDTVGNYIAFAYFEDNANGEHRISRIDYTGNAAAGVSPYNRVEFQYETRADVEIGYIRGSKTQASQRLNKILTFNGANAIGHYGLAYETGVATRKPRLVSVTQCAANGDCMNPTSFGWQEGEASLETAGINTGIPIANALYSHGFDVDGDGITDMVYPSGSTWKVRFGGTGGFTPEVDTGIANTGYQYARALDFNADGKGDLLVPYANSHWYLMRSTGDRNTPFAVPIDTGVADIAKSSNPQVADMNGDGQIITEETSSEECLSINGVYRYFGAGFSRVEEKAGSFPKMGFNEALRKASVFGEIEGVRLNYSGKIKSYSVEIFGRNISSVAPLHEITHYQLPVTCEQGKWKYHFQIYGTSDGIREESNNVYFLSKEADGVLRIDSVTTSKSTYLYMFQKHSVVKTTYRFAPK